MAKDEEGQEAQWMDNTQLGWLITLIVVVLVILFCYVYLDRTFKRLILPLVSPLPLDTARLTSTCSK